MQMVCTVPAYHVYSKRTIYVYTLAVWVCGGLTAVEAATRMFTGYYYVVGSESG